MTESRFPSTNSNSYQVQTNPYTFQVKNQASPFILTQNNESLFLKHEGTKIVNVEKEACDVFRIDLQSGQKIPIVENVLFGKIEQKEEKIRIKNGAEKSLLSQSWLEVELNRSKKKHFQLKAEENIMQGRFEIQKNYKEAAEKHLSLTNPNSKGSQIEANKYNYSSPQRKKKGTIWTSNQNQMMSSSSGNNFPEHLSPLISRKIDFEQSIFDSQLKNTQENLAKLLSSQHSLASQGLFPNRNSNTNK